MILYDADLVAEYNVPLLRTHFRGYRTMFRENKKKRLPLHILLGVKKLGSIIFKKKEMLFANVTIASVMRRKCVVYQQRHPFSPYIVHHIYSFTQCLP